MSVIDEAKAKIKGRKLRLVMPEGEDERIRAAAQRLLRRRPGRYPWSSARMMCPNLQPHHIAHGPGAARKND